MQTFVYSIVRIGLWLALAAFPCVGLAAEKETHDGFLGRIQFGLGYTRMTSEPLTIQGEGTVLTVALGGMLNEHVGLYGELVQSETMAPRFHPNGAFRDDDSDISAGIYGIGGGAVYYFKPYNLYASAAVDVVRAGIYRRRSDDDYRIKYRSDYGVGGTVSIGREWWVDAEWGLGVAGIFQMSRIPDQDDTTWQNGSFGLALSATFN